MPQYQSFPDAAGDSRTLEKLKALRMPLLAGRRFLDVGCNEGFFCGYAAFEGADVVVGLDASEEYISRARRRFPDCEFLLQGWDRLPAGPFDVIVLASALHYADDQAALIHALMSRLSRDGVLILELGIASSPKAEWIKVKRGIDERYFPTMPMVKEMLRDYAWKWMGPSVNQDGDPVQRHVIHISRLRPIAYLLMQPPAYGKTSIARALFERAGVPVISGDEVIQLVAKGRCKVPEVLQSLLAEDYSPYRIDETILKVFESGAGPDLVRLWLTQVGAAAETRDFAVDAYVPAKWHELVLSVLAGEGYMPVVLQWERAGLNLSSATEIKQQAEAFYLSLCSGGLAQAAPDYKGGAQGFVDEVELLGGCLSVRGWAVDDAGRLPKYLSIRVAGRVHMVESFERQSRPDVQRHLGLKHALCGYVASVLLEDILDARQLAEGLEVRAGNDRNRLRYTLPMAGALVEKLSGKRA